MDEQLAPPEAFASMTAPAVVVNGVPLIPLTLGGDETIIPEVPDEGSPDWSNVWPTAQIAMFRSVKMTDGDMWQVMMTQADNSGAYTITLGNPNTGVGKAFQIAAEDLWGPVWWTDAPPPSTEPVEAIPDPPSTAPPAGGGNPPGGGGPGHG